MIKKTLFLVVGLGLLSVLFFGRDAISYVATAACKVKQSVKDSVPIEFQIDRARKELEGLTPEIKRNMVSVAKEEVELERLEKRIEGLEKQIGKGEDEVMKLQADLRSGQNVFRYAGRNFSSDEARFMLASKFNRFKTDSKTLEHLRKIQATRAMQLESSRMKLGEMVSMRKQLEVQLEEVDARREAVAVAQTAEPLHFDDSALGRIKELVADLDARVAVEEKLSDTSLADYGEVDVTSGEEPETDILEEVAAYFQERSLDQQTVADAGL